ncbi:fimbrial protein StdA [Salmonella enterica]|nr:fimbrial protein StdA [Salmonella enterica]
MRNKILLAMVTAGVMMYGTSAFAEDGVTSSAAETVLSPSVFGKGTVTFTGTITEAPCDIKAGDENLSVPFGQVSYRALKATDAVDDATAKQFTIHLQNCEFDTDSGHAAGLLSKVQIAFSGTPAGSSKNAFISGANPSLGVQLTGIDGTVITPSSTPDFDKAGSPVQLSPGATDMNYTAKLMNVGAENSVKPGAFSIPVNYTLKYQ